MGISGYCITMWIISTDAPTETAADPAHFGGLLLPSTLLHPSVIALVDKEGGGGKVTQPLYTAPCADLRAKRIVHDGGAVCATALFVPRWLPCTVNFIPPSRAPPYLIPLKSYLPRGSEHALRAGGGVNMTQRPKRNLGCTRG